MSNRWPDGRLKVWYAIFSMVEGTLKDNIEDKAMAKTIAKDLSERFEGVEFRVIEVTSGGGWDSEEDDYEAKLCKYKNGVQVWSK